MSSQIAPVAKRAHKKSRNGCTQCKRRKVKCDERRPLCGNCDKHYSNIEKCDFAGQPENSASDEAFISAARPARKLLKKDKHIRDYLYRQDTLVYPPPESLGSGIDPFMSHVESKVPEVQLFMHHYFSNFTSKSFPVVLGYQAKPFLNSWWEIASDDPVLFHATLHLSAFDLDSLQGHENKTSSKQLLNKECIRLLRERVEDPLLASSDQTIGSVLFLSIVDFERGNMRMMRMHVDGLKRIVEIRGGLAAIRSTNPNLANMIFGITTTLMTEAQFPPESFESHFPDSWFTCTEPSIFNLENLGVSKDCARLIRDIKYVCNKLSLVWPSNPSENYCSEILARLMHLPLPIEEGPLVACVTEAIRRASVMLCFWPFKNDYPSPALFIKVQLHKLKAALETMIELAGTKHLLLPWLLGAGGVYAEEPERSWFVGHLEMVAADLNINSYEDLRPHLIRVVWVEFFLGEPFEELWDEVSAKRQQLAFDDLG